MKTSFCSIAFRNSDKDLSDIITFVSQTGYDAIEIWGNHLGGGLANVLAIKRQLQRSKLQVAMLSPYFDFTGPKENWLASIGNAKKFIQYASVLKAPLIRVFTGFKGSDEVDRKTWNEAVEGLKVITSIAEEQKIIMALETHPGTLTDTIDSTLRLIGDVASPNLGVNLDIYHFWDQTHDIELPLKALRPWIVHVHAKNTSLTPAQSKANPHLLLHDKQASQEFFGIAPLGEGQLPYDQFLTSLVSGGYDRYVSVEWFGGDAEQAARTELDFLRSFAASFSADAAVKKGEAADGGAAFLTDQDGSIDHATVRAAEAIEEVFATAKTSKPKRKAASRKKKTPPENQLQIDL